VTTTARPPRVNVALMPAQLQHEWDLYHATWFTLMGIGGGMFLLARLLGIERRLGIVVGLPLVDVISFVVIGVGGLVLVWSLGRPFRMLRAVLKPGTSWISRGAIADFIFVAAGGLLVLPGLTIGSATPFAWLPWDPWATTPVGKGLEGHPFPRFDLEQGDLHGSSPAMRHRSVTNPPWAAHGLASVPARGWPGSS